MHFNYICVEEEEVKNFSFFLTEADGLDYSECLG